MLINYQLVFFKIYFTYCLPVSPFILFLELVCNQCVFSSFQLIIILKAKCPILIHIHTNLQLWIMPFLISEKNTFPIILKRLSKYIFFLNYSKRKNKQGILNLRQYSDISCFQQKSNFPQYFLEGKFKVIIFKVNNNISVIPGKNYHLTKLPPFNLTLLIKICILYFKINF